jgi:hypothetical protein
MSVMPLLNVEAGTGAGEKYVLLWRKLPTRSNTRFPKIGLVR